MSKLPKDFRSLSTEKRLQTIKEAADLTDEETAVFQRSMSPKKADELIENAIGSYSLPIGIATNFRVNGKNVLVPMVTEEPSTIAAASKAAKLALPDGFWGSHGSSIMEGMVVIRDKRSERLAEVVELIKKNSGDIYHSLLNIPNPPLVKHGGGLRKIEPQLLQTDRGEMIHIRFLVDCVDAMGANAVDEYAERIARVLKPYFIGEVRLRILSNLCYHRIASSQAVWKASNLGGLEIVEGILDACAIANATELRGATHNKGIMNGIDAVLVATGNDWRAAEAGAHAFAASEDWGDGKYKSLTTFEKTEEGDLRGWISVPLAVGTVGGATNAIPAARVCRKIMGIKHASELAVIAASLGLAQNLAALLALTTKGIQSGHMALQNKRNT